MVGLLAVDLGRETRDLGVVGALERREPDLVGGLVQPVARDRPRPLEPAQLDERRAAVLLGLPVERERVGRRAELGRGELVQRPRVPDLVLGDRRERDVLLEEGRDPRPLRVPPAEDELVVGDREQEVGARRSLASALRSHVERACSLACLLQPRLDRVAVDAPVLHLELVRELVDLAHGVARDEPERDRLLPPPVLLARVDLGEALVGRVDRARVLERLALPLLSEDLEDSRRLREHHPLDPGDVLAREPPEGEALLATPARGR